MVPIDAASINESTAAILLTRGAQEPHWRRVVTADFPRRTSEPSSGEEFFETEPTPGGGAKVIIKSDAQKERFAKEVIPKLDHKYFEVFRPMFEFILASVAIAAAA